MSTFYLSIESVQTPFPFGVDGDDRTMFSCNYLGVSEAPNTTWDMDLASLISAATPTPLASLGSTMFRGPATPIPAGPGPYISIIPTAGFSPSRTHNNSKQQSLAAQIVVRGKDYTATQTLAHAVWSRLDGRYNITI